MSLSIICSLLNFPVGTTGYLASLINNYESKESACLSFFEETAEQIFKILVSG